MGALLGLGSERSLGFNHLLIYGAAFHGQSLAVFRQPRFFHAYMVLAFLTVLMTYFGVNYLLGGMHSYADYLSIFG